MRACLLLLLTAGLAACGNSAPPAVVAAPGGTPVLVLKTLSNRADLLSGGDALVELVAPDDVALSTLRFDVDGRDVSTAFARRENGRVMGLVEGLALGDNQLRVRDAKGSGSTLTLSNHPIGGPVFSGPQVQPWICDTVAAGLGPALDAQCNAASKFELVYKSSVTQQMATYNPASPPNDVAMTDTGVPYIVRVETGSMNRSIYKIAVLFDPSETLAPWSPPKGWNGKLEMAFGGGTAPHHYQDPAPNPVAEDNALRNGFMVFTSGHNVHGSNSNDNVSAEMVMMIKEHIAEHYGEIKQTISIGCSGGANQQYLIATQYPGLIDGLIPTCSYPDLHTPAAEVYVCVQMHKYFRQTSPHLWGVVQQQADVMGHSSIGPCQAWDSLFAARLDPKAEGGCKLPADQVYRPDTNPGGVRCLIYDYMASIVGRREPAAWSEIEKKIGRGFANRDVSTEGIQFGYQQLKANTILAEQFVDLNEKIGGHDENGVIQPGPYRMKADVGSVALSHRGGLISDGRQLAKVAILDLRGHDDQEIHTDDWSYVLRARLDKTNGHHDNMIIFTGAVPLIGDPAFSCSTGLASGFGASATPNTPAELCTHNPLLLMSRWLDAVRADTSNDTLERKIVKNKPADAVDTCFIGGQAITDPSVCAAAFPYYSNPIVQAGGPFTNDNFECQLKPLDRADYAGITPAMTDAQFARLQAAFPKGVCDWSKPSVHEQPSVPWLSYKAGPGGMPLGAAPVAKALRR